MEKSGHFYSIRSNKNGILLNQKNRLSVAIKSEQKHHNPHRRKRKINSSNRAKTMACTHNIFRTIHAQLHTNQYKSVYIGVCTLYWHWHDSIINIWKWWSVTLSAKWKISSLQRKYRSQHRSHWSGAITSKMDVNTYIMTPIHRYIYCLIESFFFRTSQQIKNENFRKNYAKEKINKRMNSYKRNYSYVSYASTDRSEFLMQHRDKKKKCVQSSMHAGHNEI